MRTLIALLALVFTGCGSGAHSARVVAFGDSFTVGKYNQIPFPNRVASALGGVPVENYAVGGTTISQHLDQVLTANVSSQDIVLFLSGYNDMRDYGLSGIGNYQAILSQILEKLSFIDAHVYVGTCLRTNTSIAQQYKFAAQSVVSSISNPRIKLVDTTDLFDPLPMYLQADGTHPNDAGDAVLAALFLRGL